ncbi:hypothetical protein [Streptomyces katrae]|uniref:hypothetical protein n=1 Tax=Streptomyces katrae TaxID=68223 RepID=UPI0004C137D0|nr:hypothetical protein [Streptomyces katrae]
MHLSTTARPGGFWHDVDKVNAGGADLRLDQRPSQQWALVRGWKGEVEGIELTLTFLRPKRSQVDRWQQLPR